MKRITFCHIFQACVYDSANVRDIRIRCAVTYDLSDPENVTLLNHGDPRDLQLGCAIMDKARVEFDRWNEVIYNVIGPLLTERQQLNAVMGKWHPPTWDGVKLNAGE